MNENRHWHKGGVDDPACDCGSVARSGAQRETGLRPPGKLEHSQHSQRVGRAAGEEGQPARQGRTSSAIACALPAAFQMKVQLLVTAESPKACRDRDVPLQRDGADGGLSTILCLVRKDLSAPWEARHRLATGLAVPPRGTVPEPGSSLAWRHPLPLSGDKESKPGGPQQDLGLLRRSRLGEQLALWEAQPHPSTRPGTLLKSPTELPAGSQPEGVTSCESRPS